MKRQRENFNYAFGEIAVERTKSHRTNDQIHTAEEEDLEAVIHRAMGWLSLLNPEHRPKSTEKLQNSLAKICFSTYVVDSQIIFYHLLLNNFIVLCGEGSNQRMTINPKDSSVCRMFRFLIITSKCKKTNTLEIFVPNEAIFDEIDNKVSSDFSKTLNKCVAWITSNRGFHEKTMLVSSFMPCLIQQCKIRKNVDPIKVIEHFQYRGLIAVDSNSGLLEYHLPTQQMKPCHYMASPTTEEDFEEIDM